MEIKKMKDNKNLLASLLFLSSLALSSCLNGNDYGRQEPSLPIALEAGSVGQASILKTLNLPALRKSAPLKDEREKVILEGQLICLSCEFKKEFQANSQCEKYGHQHVLKTYTGEIYHFIENDRTSNLIRKDEYQDKVIRVIGTLYKDSNVIDIISYELLAREK